MEKYYFGIGQVRSLEAHLLTPAQLERMAQASDFETALAVLAETPYAETLAKVKQAFDFEELYELELIKLKDLIEHLSLGNDFIKALFKKYDYQNIKILLRVDYLKIAVPNFSQTGTVSFEKLKAYILENQKTLDDQELLLAINLARLVLAETKDPQLMDAILDQKYYDNLKTLSQTINSKLIKNWVKTQLDSINIKTLQRLQELKKNKADFKKFILAAGFIDQDTLLELFDKSPAELNARLAYAASAPNQFQQAKYLSSGLEPLVNFYLTKENELKTIRFILISKKNFVKSEEVRERIKAEN